MELIQKYRCLSPKYIFVSLRRHHKREKSTKTIEKNVIISTSQDIYTNLALEDWFYKYHDFRDKHMLMLWRNKPCVVIGKFQNPWLECNVPELNTLLPDGINLARRNSGGGTVYHDLGNLNLTFFTPRDDYKRTHNLEIITRAIFRRFGVKIDISEREDLVFGEFKVSGTAAKLSRTMAYHHCTLLVNSDKEILSKSLRKPDYSIETKASQSIRSPIKNLRDLNDKLNVEGLIDCIGEEYLSTIPYIKGNYTPSVIFNNVKCVTPSEDLYPGISDIRDELKSFDFIFGKCPDFTAKKEIIFEENNKLIINIKVEKGVITEVDNNLDLDLCTEQFKERKFDENIFKEITDLIKVQFKRKTHQARV